MNEKYSTMHYCLFCVKYLISDYKNEIKIYNKNKFRNNADI